MGGEQKAQMSSGEEGTLGTEQWTGKGALALWGSLWAPEEGWVVIRNGI